jgi:hypothetical protein
MLCVARYTCALARRLLITAHYCSHNTNWRACSSEFLQIRRTCVAEPHHFYAAPAPEIFFYATPAPFPALIFSKPTFWKQTKVNLRIGATFSFDFCMIEMVKNVNGKVKKLLQFVTFLIIHLCWTSSLEPKPHRVAAPALSPSPSKWCASLRLRFRNTAKSPYPPTIL